MVNRIGLAISGDPADLYLDAVGNLALVQDAEAIGQHARQRLMAHEGEWFLDTTAGVAWIPQILGAAENLPLAEAVIKAEILDTDGVTTISEFSIRRFPSSRRVDVPSALVSTVYDEETTI
ncbi:hypothetical protein SAMN02745911_1222 [Aureimonas altamirensis DSM 21988]|uniref:Uncharacterized protein n=2 Tax=Aureimonas altamirensis TaxID=370622 RepID=A0A0P0YXC1_9HYPH|nr:hypothetical protein [Aureimonas altamirensis]BAT26077.1 hypothetical protein [Aureimonas altamirensis]SHI80463.1 hypothetical protein SAMN02745911_1222 [Aureimonas altamirensis DSM 21988]